MPLRQPLHHRAEFLEAVPRFRIPIPRFGASSSAIAYAKRLGLR
jgi:hypothetical protein